MAREAGAELAELPMMDAFVFSVDDKHWNSKALERFEALVRADEREAIISRLLEIGALEDGAFIEAIRARGNT
jgi:hypothetical protein